jgi:hypothetical protein
MHITFSFSDVLMKIEPDLVLNQTGLQMFWKISSNGVFDKTKNLFRTAPKVLS